MECDIIVEHDGRRWLVVDGRLRPLREIEVDADPKRIHEAIPRLRSHIFEYIAKNDPFCSVFTQK